MPGELTADDIQDLESRGEFIGEDEPGKDNIGSQSADDRAKCEGVSVILALRDDGRDGQPAFFGGRDDLDRLLGDAGVWDQQRSCI